MAKNKLLKVTAGLMSVALLANTCLTGIFTASAEEAANNAANNETQKLSYIDNSSLLPPYLPNDKVTLEMSDGGGYLTPDWVKTLIVTEVNVETCSTGTFAGMTSTLEHLAETGVNGIWLTPINEDKLSDGTSTKGNKYSNLGPDTISSALTGTEYGDKEAAYAAVKKFVDKAHSLNIRVFFDVVTWGVNEDAPLRTEHSNWFKADGYKESWNGYLFDWDNAESTGLYDYCKNSMIELIKNTGADGFRADCGSSYAGLAFFRDVKETLINDGYKIAMMSEHPEERDGTFDFEEHSHIDNVNYTMFDSHKFYMNGSIVDLIQNAAFTGNGRFYTSMVSCHDYNDYSAKGNLIQMGYASILTPYIPLWFLGEEWNNTRLESSQLYGNTIHWDDIDTNRDYYEKIKSYIRVRRLYPEIFEDFNEDNKNNNICSISTGRDDLLEAYCRYSNNSAVIVVPNNTENNIDIDVEIPVFDITLNDNNTYRLVDALTDEVLINNFTVATIGDATFGASIKAGEIGVYAIEEVTNAKGDNYTWISETASMEANDPNPGIVLQVWFDKDIAISKPEGVALYWVENLQQPMSYEQDINNTGYYVEHNALAKALQENIIINDMSLKEALEVAGITAVHVTTASDGNGQKLVLKIRKANNPFNITDTTPIRLKIKNGIRMNGYALNAKNIVWTRVNETSSNGWAKTYNDTAKILNVDYQDNVITLTSDTYLERFGTDYSTAVASKILINGTAVSSSDLSFDKNQIKIAYTADDNFDIFVNNGIIVNDKELSSARFNIVPSLPEKSELSENNAEAYASDYENGVTLNYGYVLEGDLSKIGCTGQGHGDQAHWIVNLFFDGNQGDKKVKDSSIAAFWRYHATIAANPSSANSTLGATLRDAIKINGKTLAECIAEDGRGEWKAIHVAVNSDHLIQFAIPKDNGYGFDATKPFTISVGSGVKLNGYYVNPRQFNCPGWDGTTQYTSKYFGKVLETTDPNASVTLPDVTDGNTPYYAYISDKTLADASICSDGKHLTTNPTWLISVVFQKNIQAQFNQNASYYRQHATVTAAINDATKGNSTVGKALADRIKINGKTITECVAEENAASGRNEYNAIHVSVANEKTMIIAIPKDNAYGFNPYADSSITFDSGIVLNGSAVNPRTLSWKNWDGSAQFNANYFSTVSRPVSYATCEKYTVNTISQNGCISHDEEYKAVEQWAFDFYFDKDIYETTFKEGYYRTHLQATGETDVRLNTSNYEVFRNNIYINGKSLVQIQADSAEKDYTKLIHIQSNSQGQNYFRIMIPKNNTYGFDANEDYSITIGNGIVLNSNTLKSYTLTHKKATKSEISKVELTANNNSTVQLEGNYAVVKFDDKNVSEDTAVSGMTNGLYQDINTAKTDSQRELAAEIMTKIKINGETIGEGNARANMYGSALCYGGGRILKISFDYVAGTKDNVYKVNPTEACTIEVTEGFYINGYYVNPFVYWYNGNGSCATSTGLWPQVNNNSDKGSIDLLNNGEWITHSQNMVKAGDEVTVRVKPNSGSAIKMGSLTYSYWYKGEKITRNITDFVSTTEGNSDYTFKMPEVVCTVGYEFISSDSGINISTLGAQSKASGEDGIRFINRLSLANIDLANKTVTINGDVYNLVDKGVQIAIKDGENEVDWSNAYTEAGDTVSVNEEFLDFSATILNIADENSDIKFASRAYVTYNDGTKDVTVYSDGVVRSVSDLK